MRRWQLSIVLLVLWLVILGGYASTLQAGIRAAQNSLPEGVPPAEFIAAAMQNQEALCGGSLEVEYTNQWQIENGNEPGDNKTRTHRYVRTPEVLRADKTRVSTGHRMDVSYDRQSGEYRYLIHGTAEEPSGVISQGLQNPFGRQDFFETVRFGLHEGRLYQRIGEGTVLEQTETVDGYECWRVEIPTSYLSLQEYVVWVDSSIGFNPRKIEFVKKTGRRTQ